MQDIFSIIATLALVVVDVGVAFTFTSMIESLLSKDRIWISLLMIITGIILLQASVYSWLPQKIGMEFQLLDGAITLRDKALFSNLGALLIAQGIGIAFALAKHLWGAIRKKNRFYGAAFALELLFLVLYIAGGSALFHEDPVVGESASDGTLIGLAAAGAFLLAVGIKTAKGRKQPAVSQQ